MTPMRSSLPDDLVELLAEMYGEVNPATGKRWTTGQLATFAAQRLGRPVTRPVVDRAIAPLRAEWARVAREVARERIGAKLPAQLDALDDMIAKVQHDFVEAATAKERAAALDAYHKGLTLKLRYSGVGESVDVSGAVDVTSDGQRLAFYVPIKRADDGSSPDPADAPADAPATPRVAAE